MRLPPNIPTTISNEIMTTLSEDIRTFIEMVHLLRQRHVTDTSNEVREQIHSLLQTLKEKKKQFLQELAKIAEEDERGELVS